jgi:hypothetical protein
MARCAARSHSDLDWNFDNVPDNELIARRMRRGKPGLPWKRDPAAWKNKQDLIDICLAPKFHETVAEGFGGGEHGKKWPG